MQHVNVGPFLRMAPMPRAYLLSLCLAPLVLLPLAAGFAAQNQAALRSDVAQPPSLQEGARLLGRF